MPRPIAYARNLLEQSGVTFTVTGEAAGKEKERLSDRDIGLLYQDSGITSPRLFTADQGSSGSAWDTVIVPPGHNLAGLTCLIETSTDMAGWTQRDSFTAPSGLILRTPAGGPYTARGVRFNVQSPASPPSFAELLFATTYDFAAGPSIGGLRAGNVSGVTRTESPGGYVWKVRKWGPRWTASYRLDDLTVAQRDALLAVYEDLKSGARPFYLADHDGIIRWVEWVEPELLFEAAPVSLHGTELTVQEVA